MAELSRVSELSYKAFLCVLVIALSPDAGITEILKELVRFLCLNIESLSPFKGSSELYERL